LLQDIQLLEFVLHLSSGSWSSELWGKNPAPAPTGLFLWARFAEGNDRDIISAWTRLSHQLGALFGFPVHGILTSIEKRDYGFKSLHSIHDRVHRLPRESVCSDTVFRWIKHLPCTDKGLAAIFSAQTVAKEPYISLGIRAKRTQDNDNASTITEVDVDVEYTVTTALRNPLADVLRLDYRLSACPFANVSRVVVARRSESHKMSSVETHPQSWQAKFYDIAELTARQSPRTTLRSLLNDKEKSFAEQTQAVDSEQIQVDSFIAGSGFTRRSIVIQLSNIHPTANASTLVFQPLPAFVRPYLHQLHIKVRHLDTKSVSPCSITEGCVCATLESIEDGDADKGFMFQLIIKARSLIVISFEVDLVFQHVDEFPPDAHRAIEVPGCTVIYSPNDGCLRHFAPVQGCRSRGGTLCRCQEYDWLGLLSMPSHQQEQEQCNVIYADHLLTYMPTPDFSMPYNVAVMTSTTIALFTGSLIGLVTRTNFEPRQRRFLARVFSRKSSQRLTN